MAAEAPTKEEKEFFKDMNPDEDIDAVTKIESLCVACGDNGMTRLLLTKIPFFREVIIMAFECDKCGFRSSEISPAGSLADKAVRFELHVNGKDHPEVWSQEAFHADMNRQLVKSDSAVVRVPELEFEIPRNKRGEINTVEGILTVAADTLEMDQEARKVENEAVYLRVQEIVNRLRRLVEGQESFTIVLEDLAGNSFLENPCAPEPDPRVKLTTWYRSNAELEELGYMVDETKNEAQDPNAFPSANPGKKDNYKVGGRIGHAKGVDVDRAIAPKLDSYFDVDERAAFLPGECPSCHQTAETRMCVTDLPYFKEVVIMATQCDNCGYRTTDIKPGGEVSSKGRRLTLRVSNPDDFKRDVMKSDTASLDIPELELHLGEGTLGGKYTTLEGLLDNIKTEMQKLQAFKVGDSATPEKRASVENFFKTLDEIVSGARPFTFILDDPLANSFIYSELPEGQDPALTTEDYERSFEQNEDLGLNDINVDHYLTPEQEAEQEAEKQGSSQ